MSIRYLKIGQWSIALTIVFALFTAWASAAATSLEDLVKENGLKIDAKQISVSGISSGGFMAHQFHVVHAPHIIGSGIIAAGPYHCAKGSVMDAITKCSTFTKLSCQQMLELVMPKGSDLASICEQAFLGPKNETESKEMAMASYREAIKQNGENLKKKMENDRVYIFRGMQDSIVPDHVADAVYHFYVDPDNAGLDEEQVRYNDRFPVRHAMVRDHRLESPPLGIVNKCNQPPSAPGAYDTYIDDCQKAVATQLAECNCSEAQGNDGPACAPSDPAQQETCLDVFEVDLAGAILQHIYGKLNDRAVADGELLEFSQKDVFGKFSKSPATAIQNASMEDADRKNLGYIFIPETCKGGAEACKLHVAFHGCKQGGETAKLVPGDYSGNLFSQFAGYNEWATTNQMVVLYPQVRIWNSGPTNPEGCWDWWGQNYTHENYHTKKGLQIKAVAQMINILVGEDLLEVPKE